MTLYFGHIKVEVPVRHLTGNIKEVFGSGPQGFKSKVETGDVPWETSEHGEHLNHDTGMQSQGQECREEVGGWSLGMPT